MINSNEFDFKGIFQFYPASSKESTLVFNSVNETHAGKFKLIC